MQVERTYCDLCCCATTPNDVAAIIVHGTDTPDPGCESPCIALVPQACPSCRMVVAEAVLARVDKTKLRELQKAGLPAGEGVIL